MRKGGIDLDESDDKPIFPWRLVIGGFIHFVIPAYIATLVIGCLALSPPDAKLPDLLRMAGPLSAWFFLIYTALAGLLALLGHLLDRPLRARRKRRRAEDPVALADRSRWRVARAAAELTGITEGRANIVLAAIGAARWDHDDPRFQALSVDLAELARTATAALASAAPERRASIIAMTTTSLDHISDALSWLIAERGKLDEGDARTVAHYLKIRYGPSDFTGDEPG